jgi:DNA-binding PucR family transcriptional regulator
MTTPEPTLLTGELGRLHALAAAVQCHRSTALLAALERTRGRLDELVQRVEQLDHALPDYAAISHEEIRQVVVTILELGIRLLSVARAPDSDDYRVMYGLAQIRADQGVSASSFMLAAQLGISEFLGVFDEEARAADLPADEVLALHDSVRDLTNLLVATLSTAYREHAQRDRRDLVQRQTAFLRSVVFGNPDPRKIERNAPALGLDPTTEYFALYAPLSGPVPARARDIRRAVVDAAPDAIAAIVEDRVVGLATRPPVARPELAVLGVGGPVRLVHLGEAFDEARGAAEAAVELGHKGVVDYAALGPLPLLVSASGAASALDRKYCAPLDAEGRVGREIATTVSRFLTHDHNIDAVAAELHVHRNTVHHRLRRFRELTGLDVRCTNDLVLSWWLLGRRGIVGQQAAAHAHAHSGTS